MARSLHSPSGLKRQTRARAGKTPPASERVARTVRDQARDFALLLKPRVMSLVVFTGLVGLYLAPGHIDALSAVLTVAWIALGAGASGAINMWYDRDIDKHMQRTMNRPIPAGHVRPAAALWYGVALSLVSVGGMAVTINLMAAAILAVTILFYVFVYTVWLKRRTPQNIVIGGAAGAFPPMIGWAAVTGGIGWESAILFAIIFMWTPPHFWALALYVSGDYEKVGIPMMPQVAGVKSTKIQILVYTLLLAPVTFLPTAIGMSGWIYGAAAIALNAWFIVHAIRVFRSDDTQVAKRMFLFSILYLFLIFVALVADKALAGVV